VYLIQQSWWAGPWFAAFVFPVDFVIGLMADGSSDPGLSRDDIAACLARARDVLSSEKVYPSAA
jgi:hypothetical protein